MPEKHYLTISFQLSRKDMQRHLMTLSKIPKRKTLIKFAILNVQDQDEHRKSSEAVVQRCSVKKAFLEISQNSQENTFSEFSGKISLKLVKYWSNR